MRLTIITDAEGNILGTARVVARDKEAPLRVAVSPEPGQMIYEVEVPDEVAKIESAVELHEKLVMEAGVVELIERYRVWDTMSDR